MEELAELHVRTGVDLVSLPEFRESQDQGGETLRRRLFHPSEVKDAGTVC